ncbi:MAG: WD40 repeat domain-containing serine/threonine protein kinase [Pirellulales bacterium]
MNPRDACPPEGELHQLLEGSLSGQREHECTEHLDQCSCCQAKLEGLATGSSNLCELVKEMHRDEPPATSAYWPALSSLQSHAARTAVQTPAPGARSRDLSLEFLLPASDAAYLGRLAHFDVMRVIGRGGMGLVLEAFDSRLQRNVAVKVLDPELRDDETARQRFCREARAAASITHENVVAVHQVEKAGEHELPYLVMQLITGESLEQRLARDGRQPFREVVRIGMQAAHGLAAAHAQGLIHRDIKPGNILLETPSGRVKLTDFGLARAAEDLKLTRTGFVPGTPLYMSPEQAMGEATDQRSDIFSLGAALYEMAAGRPPFPGNSSLAILKQVLEARHRPLRELNPEIPQWFSDTIDRMLAKRPADRLQTAEQLAELFEFEWALMKTSSEDVPQLCEIERKRRARRTTWFVALVGASFLGFGLLAGMLLTSGNRPPASAVSTSEPVAVLAANAGAVWSVAFSSDNNTVAMAVEDGAVRLWDLHTKSIEATLDAHRGNIWSVCYSPDGQLLATAGDDGLIKLWQLGNSAPLKTFQHRNAVRGLAFAADGRTVIAGDRDGGLRVWSLGADEPVAAAQQPSAIYAVAISPDGQTVATGGSDKVVRLWNSKTLTQKLPLEGHAGPVYGVSFSRDGTRLASAGWDKTVHIWDVASGAAVKSWPGHDGDIWSIAYSPDGAKVATGGTDGAAKMWDAKTGELLANYLGHKTGIHTIAFSPEGSRLASGGRDGVVRIWLVE